MSDVFERFAPRLRPAAPAAEPAATPADTVATDQAVYQALTTDPTNRRTPARLKIEYGDGSVSLIAYSYLVEVLTTSPQFLSLIFTHCVLTCEGRNLQTLVEALQEEKARALHCFHPHRYAQPPADKPLITRIRRERRPAAAAMESLTDG